MGNKFMYGLMNSDLKDGIQVLENEFWSKRIDSVSRDEFSYGRMNSGLTDEIRVLEKKFRFNRINLCYVDRYRRMISNLIEGILVFQIQF